MITIYLARKAQIALLLGKKVTVSAKYSDFTNVFSEKLENVFSKHIKVSKYAIELEKGKQPLNLPIYSLKVVEFKIFKTYMETNLANGFIGASKLLTNTLILFIRKLDGNLCLYVNCQKFNNPTIKN